MIPEIIRGENNKLKYKNRMINYNQFALLTKEDIMEAAANRD